MSDSMFHFEDMFLSVGLDVAADFTWMSIALPNQTFVGKPFKILHADLDSLSCAVSKIKEAEKLYSLESRIFLESTGIYHYPLFYFFRDKGLNCNVINPIITKNSTNINIRKVHNDKFDSKKAALVGLKPDLKVSLIPSDLVLNVRNLTREYYDLSDKHAAYVNKLHAELRIAFPQYLGIFSKITTKTSLSLLEKYTSPTALLDTNDEEIITLIRSTARFGITYATKKWKAIQLAAHAASIFGHAVDSNWTRIRLYVSFIRLYQQEMQNILTLLHTLMDTYKDTLFVKQIQLIETFKGAGFLSAVSIMAELGDFQAFQSPKQLFSYFGMDPAVKSSGKFVGTKVSMSKRGSRIARRVIHTMALNSIGTDKKGNAKNPVLRNFYLKKCESKPKMVAMGAVMHKVCNILFAVLRDEKEFQIITPEEHIKRYQSTRCDLVA
jgi:transposase